MLLRNRLSVGIGLISYSLYLIHWPAIVFFKYYTFSPLGNLDKCALLVGSLAAACLMYRYVETPFRRAPSARRRLSGPAFVLLCVVLALGLILLGATVRKGDGWAWRIPSVVVPSHLAHETPVPFKLEWQKAAAERNEWTGAYSVGRRSRPDRTALVLGDSHAGQLRSLADYLGAKYAMRFSFFTFTGCTPLFGTFKVYGRGGVAAESPKQRACREQTAIWERHVRDTRYDYVVLASRWAWLYEPTQYEGYEVRRDLLVMKDAPVYDVAASRRTFSRQLRRTVQAILNSGAQAIVFSQVPNHGKVLEGCDNLPRYIIRDARVELRCTAVSKAAVLTRLQFTNEQVREVGRLEGVHTVVPTDFFCDAEQSHCRLFDGGIRLSDDSDHINEFGAIFLAKRWEAQAEFPFRQ